MMIIIMTATFVLTLFLVIVSLYEAFGKNEGVNKRLDAVSGKAVVEEKKPLKEKGNLLKKFQKQQSDRKEKFNREKAKRERNNEKESAAEIMLEMADVDMTPEQLQFVKVVSAFSAVLLTLIVTSILKTSATMSLLAIVVMGLLGMLAPSQVLKSRVTSRKKRIRNQLPDVMDLLVVSVEAGLGFDAALVRLYEKDKSDLMKELMQATRDIRRGMSKKDAYNSLARRCDVKELTSFLTAMVQADQMGVSVRSVLKIQSATLREKRRQRAEEKALKAPVLMLLPMVGFIFPVIFIILLGPAVMSLMENF